MTGIVAADRSGSEAGASFAELVRRHRAAAELSQLELARRCGLSERAVRDLERGTTAKPRRHSVRALAAAMGLHGEDLAVFLATARGQPVDAPAAAAVPVTASEELVGRVAELRTLVDLVRGGRHRLITVTGPSGVGKSRLVAELVGVLRRYAGLDVRAVDLSALRDPDLVGELIAEALGFGGPSRLKPVERIATALRDRRVVLVLDGFERLVTAAPEVAALVRRCAGLCVLATSQRALRAAGERLVPLEPLPVAAAVDLFARRAGAVSPGFSVTDANRAAVAAICRQVDGLPLAIELAAARMRMLSPAELAARLDRPLLLLTGGARDLPARHRSLRAAIESSLEMVSDDARTAFAWLAPFVAGARLSDLEAVAGRLAAEPGWLLDALAGLVESSLLQVRAGDADTRYVLLDAVRDLSTEVLSARVDRPRVERAYAAHYLARLTAANDDGARAAWAGLDADADNVRAALAWARASDPALADAGVVEALYRYCDLRGRFVEGRAELVALADSGAAGAGRALVRAAQFSQFLGDLDETYELVLRGQRQMAADDHAGRALAGLVLGTRAYKRGDLTGAATHITAALHDAQATGDRRTIGWALNNLAAVTAQAGDWSGAQDLLRRALTAKEESGADDVDIGRTLILLAELALATRQWATAVEHAARAADTLGRAGHARLEAAALSALALARLDGAGRTRDVEGAARAMEQAVRLLDSFGQDQWIRGLVQTRRSVVLHALGQRDDVAAVLADALRATRTDPMLYTLPPVIECHAALLARRRPPAAAQLRDLARAIRHPHERAPGPPASAVLATMADIVAAALSSPHQ